MVFESAEKPHFGDFSTFLYSYAGKFSNNILISCFFVLFVVGCYLGELKEVKRRHRYCVAPSGPLGAPRGASPPEEAPVALASAVIYIYNYFYKLNLSE